MAGRRTSLLGWLVATSYLTGRLSSYRKYPYIAFITHNHLHMTKNPHTLITGPLLHIGYFYLI